MVFVIPEWHRTINFFSATRNHPVIQIDHVEVLEQWLLGRTKPKFNRDWRTLRDVLKIVFFNLFVLKVKFRKIVRDRLWRLLTRKSNTRQSGTSRICWEWPWNNWWRVNKVRRASCFSLESSSDSLVVSVLDALINTSMGCGSNPTIGIQSSIVTVNFYRTMSVR
jgi:hypothetical protein